MIELGLRELGKEEESVEGPKDNRKGWQRAAWQALQVCWGSRSGQDWEDRRSERERLPRHYGFFSRMGMELILAQ